LYLFFGAMMFEIGTFIEPFTLTLTGCGFDSVLCDLRALYQPTMGWIRIYELLEYGLIDFTSGDMEVLHVP